MKQEITDIAIDDVKELVQKIETLCGVYNRSLQTCTPDEPNIISLSIPIMRDIRPA